MIDRRRALTSALTGIACIGLVSSLMLLSHHHTRTGTGHGPLAQSLSIASESLCGPDTGYISCARVSESRYSSIGGFPLAGAGIFYFTLIMILALFVAVRDETAWPGPRALFFAFTSIGSIAAVFLLVVSIGVIHGICTLCVVTYFCSWSSLVVYYRLFGKESGNPADFAWKEINIIKGVFSSNRLNRIIVIAAVVIVSLGMTLSFEYLIGGPGSSAGRGIGNPVSAAASVFHGRAVKFGAVPLPVSGNTDAPVEIVEFSDFLCPACARSGLLLEKYASSRQGKVRLTFFNLPLDSACNPSIKTRIHPGACEIALGSFAASRQGRFREYYDAAFSGRAYAGARDIATAASLDLNAFDRDMGDPALETLLAFHVSEAANYGIRSTPSIYINGKKYAYPVREDVLDLIVEEEIKTRPLKDVLEKRPR
ncbi:MAG: hypothetical protein EPN93_11545 [Spirochaetes bacterium]|nr:MAG: hypothetical protein EPN93_11545 [Spirochaetota bacterium]